MKSPGQSKYAFATCALILSVLALRIVWLVWLSRWELIGDEAYYWEQSRHLDFGNSEKGPLLSWMIAASCRALGNTEYAVRMPVVIASALSAWGIWRLSLAMSGATQRGAFFAVAIFCLIPAFQANAQICTQDGPLIAIWL